MNQTKLINSKLLKISRQFDNIDDIKTYNKNILKI